MADDDPLASATDEVDAPEVLTSRKASPEEPYRAGEANIVEFIEGMYAEARDSKKAQCAPDTWSEDLDCYWGNQWPASMPDYKPRIVVNIIKKLVLEELSDLTDSKLKVFVQKDRKTMEQDTVAEQTIQAYWQREFCDLTVMSAALDGMIYPLGFFQTGWDPLAQQGQGEVVFRHRDPESVFPDGDAEDDRLLRYFVLRDVLDLVQIRRDFPETGWLVPPEAQFSEPWQDRKKDRLGPRGGQNYTGPLYSHTPLGGGLRGWKKARARVLTAVIDDDDIIEEVIELQDEAGLRLQGVIRPKYPNRRMVILANRRVLYDEDCPYHHAPILVSVPLQPRVHAYWPAASLVSEFASIQSTANKHDSMVAENHLRMNVGETFADADSGLDPQTYGGVPGAVHLVKPGARIMKEYPPQMPPDMLQAGARLRGVIQEMMGHPGPRVGSASAGNIAHELVETEISQSMGVTRLRSRLLYQAVQKGVEMIFARMAQFYQSPRHLPYIERGSFKSVRWEPVADPSTYAVHVDPSSFNVKSKTMQQRLALALAKMGKYPTEDLLQDLEIPDAAAKASKITAELAMAAMAKQKTRAR